MKSALVIAAHPDDEVLGCGGLMAKLSATGVEVSVLLLTGGISSRYSEPEKKMQLQQEKIKKHALLANKTLGVNPSNLHFLGFEDQKLDAVPLLEVTRSIKNIIQKLKPEVVYTHHRGDYNMDHRVCFDATLVATRITPEEYFPKRLYCYEVLSSSERSFGSVKEFIPNTYVNIDKYIKVKQRALAAYKTELHRYPHPRSTDGVGIWAKARGLQVGYKFAEVFQLIRSMEG